VKAKDLTPGDTVEGWTVTEAGLTVSWNDVRPGTQVVLLTLEREATAPQWDGTDHPLGWNKFRRTWYRADEEVEP